MLFASVHEQYRLKVTFTGKGVEPLYQYVAFDSRDDLVFLTTSHFDKSHLNSPKYSGYTICLPKKEWKYILPEVKHACENSINGIGSWYSSYKLNFEEAFTLSEVVMLRFIPGRQYGIQTLAQLKKELKLKGISPIAVEQTTDSYRMKYYVLYIDKRVKSKLDSYLKARGARNLDYVK